MKEISPIFQVGPLVLKIFPGDCSVKNFKTTTVNVVIFAGGKFRENVGKTFHMGVIFTILLLFSS